MAYQADEPSISSPDPLNDTTVFSSPARPRQTPQTRKSFPLSGSSPRKQTFELDVGNKLSPQKLRVTVEADDSNKENRQYPRKKAVRDKSPLYKPTIRPNERTRTTTIPVKGLSDSEDESFEAHGTTPTRGRGRPRKSGGTPKPTKSRNRSSTPGGARSNSRRRKTLGSLVDGDDSDDWNFTLSDGVEINRGRGRSRSGSIKSSTTKKTPAAKKGKDVENLLSSATSLKGRSRRRTLMPEEFQILEDAILDGDEPNQLETRQVLSSLAVNIQSPQWVGSPTTVLTSELRLSGETRGESSSGIGSARAQTNPSRGRQEYVQGRGPLSPTISSQSSSEGPQLRGSANPHARGISTPTDFSSLDNILHSSTQQTSQEPHIESVQATENHENYHEFDTILESEGFSMISVESVPSIREHLSSPVLQSVLRNEKSPITLSPALSSARIQKSTRVEDSFSSLAPEILEAATPGRKLPDPRLLSVKETKSLRIDDSFSSIPPEVLEAATPARQLQNKRVLALKPTPSKSRDDSFSTIPSEVLEAATPGRNQYANHYDVTESEADSSTAAGSMLLVPAVAPSNSLNRSQVSSRLLTPDRTPSPEHGVLATEEAQDPEDNISPAQAPQRAIEPSSPPSSNINSSPPNHVAPKADSHGSNHDQQEQSFFAAATPSIVFSSPTLPPHPPAVVSYPTLAQPKPSISPIVRAGRSLQEITAPPSSSSHSSRLRSPFTSPNGRRNSATISRPTFGSLHFDDTLGEGMKQTARPASARTSSSHDDPFGANLSSKLPSSVSRESREYKLELPRPGSFQSHGTSSVSRMSIDNEFMNEEVISQARSSNKDDLSRVELRKSLDQKHEEEWAAERAAVSQEINSASTSQVVVISSDNMPSDEDLPQSEEAPVMATEEDVDIWQAEARDSSSLVEDNERKQPKKKIALRHSSSSKIPTPSSVPSLPSSSRSKLEQSLPPLRFSKVRHDSSSGRKADVQVIKPMPIGKVLKYSQPIADDETLPDLSEMWHIPQKRNFTPRSRPRDGDRLDFSALLASSPLKLPQHVEEKSYISPTLEATVSQPEDSIAALDDDDDDEIDVSQSLMDESAQSISTPTPSRDFPEEAEPASIISTTEVDDSEQEDSVESTQQSISRISNGDVDEEEEDSYTSNQDLPILPTPQPRSPSLSPSPKKSCLRTPRAESPSKRVSFSPTTKPSTQPIPPPPPPLSSTTWSKSHWKLLNQIHIDFISDPTSLDYCPLEKERAKRSKYLGLNFTSQGENIMVELWHLVIVELFLEEVPGWEQGDVTKRLCSIFVGDKRRAAKREEGERERRRVDLRV